MRLRTMIKFNSITIEIDELNNAHGGKEAVHFALAGLLKVNEDRTLENMDGHRLFDVNGNSIGSVSVDWEEIDFFEDVESFYTVENCNTSNSEDSDNFCDTLLVLEMKTGGYWYCVEGGETGTLTSEAPTDYAMLTRSCEIDYFELGSGKTIDTYEELAELIHDH